MTQKRALSSIYDGASRGSLLNSPAKLEGRSSPLKIVLKHTNPKSDNDASSDENDKSERKVS